MHAVCVVIERSLKELYFKALQVEIDEELVFCNKQAETLKTALSMVMPNCFM